MFTGPNESGKTTLASFLKFIFYGYSGAKQQKTDMNEKKLFTPWSNNKVAGSVIIHYKDKKYKIEREYAERDKKRIIDLSNNVAIQDGEDPGMFFFRMDEEVFSKTAFLKQFETSEIGGKSLADMVQNLMFTADEDMNTQKTLSKLNDARAALLSKNKNSGAIYKLSKKRDELSESFDKSVQNQHELLRLEGMIKDLEEKMHSNNAKKNELNDELENYKAYNAGQELQKIESSRKQAGTLKEAYERVVAKYANGDFIPDMEYSRELLKFSTELREKKLKLAEANHQRNISLEKYNDCNEKNKNFKSIENAGGIEEIGSEFTSYKKTAGMMRVMMIIFAALTLIFAGAAVYMYLSKIFVNYIVFAAPALTLTAFFIFLIMRANASGKAVELYTGFGFETENDFATVLDDYPDTEAQLDILKTDLKIYDDAALKAELEFNELYTKAKNSLMKWNRTPEDDDKNPDEFVKFSGLASEAAEDIQRAKNIWEQYQTKLDFMLEGINENELKRVASYARKPNYDEKQISRELDFILKANESMHEKEHEIEKNIAVVSSKLPDPAVLSSQIAFLEDNIKEMTKKHDALVLAIETLEQSCDELKNSVAPRLTSIAGNLFRMATGGRYQELLIDTAFTLDISDGSISRDIDFLSAGARDMAYVCFRMALLDILYENEMPPFICDDPFVRLDRRNLANMTKIIHALSRKTQIMYFTCHEREIEALREIDAHIINV